MKKFIFGLVLVLAGAFFANAQTIQLTPLELGGNYVQHIEGDKTITVSKVPEWKRTAKPSHIYYSFLTLSILKEHENWVKIEASYFSSDSSYSLSKDSAGNVWIVKSSYSSKTPVLYAILDSDVNTIEDLVGNYWVSWKLIDGTKDIYPVLHKE